jgi:hypothetical protein
VEVQSGFAFLLRNKGVEGYEQLEDSSQADSLFKGRKKAEDSKKEPSFIRWFFRS